MSIIFLSCSGALCLDFLENLNAGKAMANKIWQEPAITNGLVMSIAPSGQVIDLDEQTLSATRTSRDVGSVRSDTMIVTSSCSKCKLLVQQGRQGTCVVNALTR